MAIMRMAKTVMKNLFSKPATYGYPDVKRQYPARTRGHVAIDIDTCIFCGLCSRKCPTGAIRVDRNGKSWSIEPFSCIQCNCCVETCPKKCLQMENNYTEPGAHKLLVTYTQNKPGE
jgi:ech hydrogenase subunit F